MAPTHKKNQARNPTRIASVLSALLASSALLLSACGGDDGSPQASATASNTGGEPGTVAAPTRNNTSASLLFAHVNLVDASGAPTGQKLVLVDPATGAVVQQIAVDDQSSQLATQAFTMSANGLVKQTGDDKKLYYTNQGKLFEINLVKSGSASPGVGRQVSSEAHICALAEVIPKDAAATASWIVVNSAGPDGACEFSDDNEVQLISSEMQASVPALKLTLKPRQVLRILDVQRDNQGDLGNLIGYVAEQVDSTAGDVVVTKFSSLALISMSAAGAATTLAELKADEHGDLPSITSFGKVAGSNAKVYLQVGHDIRELSWASGTPVLAPAAVETLASGVASFVRTDDKATYYVDGAQIKALSSTGVRQIDSLTGIQPVVDNGDALPESTDEVQPGGGMTDSALLLVTRKGNNYSLRVVRKSGGPNATSTVAFGSGSALKVEAVHGDTAVVSQADAAGQGVTLWRVDTASVNGTPITPSKVAGTGHAQVIAVVHGDTTTLSGETQGTHIVWCDAAQACSPQNVNSYQLASGSGMLLSPAGIAGTPLWSGATASSRSTTLGLMTSAASPYEIRNDGAMLPIKLVSDGLWLFDAAAPGSLTRVSLPSAP